MSGLDELEPRLRTMISLILANRSSICSPKKGELRLHFNGQHVSAHLVGHQVLRNGPEESREQEPPDAA